MSRIISKKFKYLGVKSQRMVYEFVKDYLSGYKTRPVRSVLIGLLTLAGLTAVGDKLPSPTDEANSRAKKQSSAFFESYNTIDSLENLRLKSSEGGLQSQTPKSKQVDQEIDSRVRNLALL